MRVNLNENQFIEHCSKKRRRFNCILCYGIKIGVLDPNKMPVGMTNILMVNTKN